MVARLIRAKFSLRGHGKPDNTSPSRSHWTTFPSKGGGIDEAAKSAEHVGG